MCSLYQTPYPKGEGESGTVAYTAICSAPNFRGMSLIGSVLLNCILALHRWLSMEKCSDSASITPLELHGEPPHHLHLVLRKSSPELQPIMAFCMQLYQTPPPPLGREYGTETSVDWR